MPLSPAEKQARYRERQRAHREAEERERRDSTPLALTVADLNQIIAEASESATRAAVARFAIPGPQEAGRAPVERDGDSGRGRGQACPRSLARRAPEHRPTDQNKELTDHDEKKD